MKPTGELPGFLADLHKNAWKNRMNQLKRELSQSEALSRVEPTTQKHGQPDDSRRTAPSSQVRIKPHNRV